MMTETERLGRAYIAEARAILASSDGTQAERIRAASDLADKAMAMLAQTRREARA